MNINLQKFNNFKKFVEYEVGLNSNSSDYKPNYFKIFPFIDSVLRHQDKEIELIQQQKFNEGKYFEIPRVVVFIETLRDEGYFLWNVDKLLIMEYEKTIQQNLNKLSQYYTEQYHTWMENKKQVEHEKISLHLPEDQEIHLETPLGQCLHKTLLDEGVFYGEGPIMIEWKGKTLLFNENAQLQVYPEFVVIFEGNKCRLYYKRNISLVTQDVKTTITVYNGEE